MYLLSQFDSLKARMEPFSILNESSKHAEFPTADSLRAFVSSSDRRERVV